MLFHETSQIIHQRNVMFTEENHETYALLYDYPHLDEYQPMIAPENFKLGTSRFLSKTFTDLKTKNNKFKWTNLFLRKTISNI